MSPVPYTWGPFLAKIFLKIWFCKIDPLLPPHIDFNTIPYFTYGCPYRGVKEGKLKILCNLPPLSKRISALKSVEEVKMGARNLLQFPPAIFFVSLSLFLGFFLFLFLELRPHQHTSRIVHRRCLHQQLTLYFLDATTKWDVRTARFGGDHPPPVFNISSQFCFFFFVYLIASLVKRKNNSKTDEHRYFSR